MKLYHFCRAKDVHGIRSDGITKGMIPLFCPMEKHTNRNFSLVIIPGWQWLTLDGDHDRQSWATRKEFKDDRTEYRFTIEIPEKEIVSLYDRRRLLAIYPEASFLFNDWDGCENWRVYRGSIPKYWIKSIEKYFNGEWFPI